MSESLFDMTPTPPSHPDLVEASQKQSKTYTTTSPAISPVVAEPSQGTMLATLLKVIRASGPDGASEWGLCHTMKVQEDWDATHTAQLVAALTHYGGKGLVTVTDGRVVANSEAGK